MIQVDLIHIIVWSILSAALIISLIIVIFYSDQPEKYKQFSILFIVLLAILEIPHFIFFDDAIYDFTVHIVAGTAIFMIFLNVKILPKRHRQLYSFFIVFGIIIFVEIFLSILEIFTTFVNPISINIFEDIVWTVIGGIIGLIIYYITKKDMKHNLIALKLK